MSESTSKITRGVYKFIDYMMFLSLAGMVLLVFINAFLRYLFEQTIVSSEELSRYLFVWTIFLGTITAYKDNQHIGVDLITSRLKGVPKKVVDLAGYILVLIAVGVMLSGGLGFTKIAMSTLGPATGIPFSFISASYVLAAVMIGFITIGKIIKLCKGE
ncbi:TRAP transporter small permease [Desulforamulus ruminis]|uniref:Tripartite ATP-independent periplasmic transporter DctQ component n=1 Tax=Desulforamulus ruminis (strain ATCC 23193 / DSM 2154 / NCIMB 8452 / DL) TaxID=696281 RepID=F6DN73_DESRL|nr:TRAP transporter small permease [Desulforamulus ruminis]AEG60662.1 Tripartite ATP-independent periplasmic transporter DctQ component [Desulforamulus ruminis DSM 2154]